MSKGLIFCCFYVIVKNKKDSNIRITLLLTQDMQVIVKQNKALMDNLECAKNMPKEMVGSQKKLHYTMTTIKIQLKLSEKPDIKQEIEYVENK